MIAIVFALTGLLAISLTGAITLTVWYRSADRRGDDLSAKVADLEKRLTSSDQLATVKTAECEQEHTLRLIAEMQRNEAMRRVGELLRNQLANATESEIQELTNAAFESPLALAPRPAAGVPQAVPRSADGDNALLDPFADV